MSRRLRISAVTNSSGLILTALIGDAILVAMAKNCVDSGIGASVEFLDRWKIHGRINLEEGGFNDTKIRHDDFDELIIRYESKDLFFFNEPSIAYGLTKIDFGGEWYATSKEIKTVERSNLSNLYSPNRSTGFLFAAEVEDFDIVLGVFSSREHNYALADWDGGRAYFTSIRTKIGKGKARADFLYVDATEVEDEIFGFEWGDFFVI